LHKLFAYYLFLLGRDEFFDLVHILKYPSALDVSQAEDLLADLAQ